VYNPHRDGKTAIVVEPTKGAAGVPGEVDGELLDVCNGTISAPPADNDVFVFRSIDIG